MSVDRDEVNRIAGLAKLSLDDGEADRLAEEMNRILEHAERLRALSDSPDPVDVQTGAEPHRKSGAAASPTPDALTHPLADFAPEMDDGFFTVPPPPGVVGSDS
ncbi:MAG: hypothetical protein HKN72_17150 [Gemmatimonadetes bacterium]|nr:hypothetical protein [Gemmatimonadota bacterium]